MKEGVRKAQNVYYPMVQLALLSPSPKGTGKKKKERLDYKRHRAGTSQDGLKMTERAAGSRTKGGTCLPLKIGAEMQSTPEAGKCMLAGPRYQSWITGHSKAQRETREEHHL